MENEYLIVLDALQKASSQNAELLKIAERQLKSWETERGFYSMLLNVACDRSLDVNVRWLSVLCIKNGIDRFWRTLSPNAIAEDEKVFIRQKILTCFDEPINQIAIQFSVIISKVARFDFPKEWPDLFNVLLNGIQSTDHLLQQQALFTVNLVIKALASKRLTPDRRVFYQLTSFLFTNLLNQWINYSKLFLQEATRDSVNSQNFMNKSLLCLKILKKLLLNGFKNYSNEPDAVNFLSLIFQQIGPFIECRTHLITIENLLELCQKYIVLLVKTLHKALEEDPISFVQFLKPTLECSVTFCFSKDHQDKLFEKLIVQFLNLIKGIIQCEEYKMSVNQTFVTSYKDELLCVQQVKQDFFSCSVLKVICDQLLSRYFLLTEKDIYYWQSSPEEFFLEEDGESWKFNLRACSENLFLTLFREFRSHLTPLVMETVNSINNTSFDILKKDAIYNAVGIAAFDLYDEIDFNNWFLSELLNELSIKAPGYHIIRRRVIWMIGQWVGIKMSPSLRSVLYQITLDLMETDEDLLVRLAAAKTLKLAIDDFEFLPVQFLPFLDRSISTLFTLLEEVKECDSKMTILFVLSFLVGRMGTDIRPHANVFKQHLPPLWDNCGDHFMLRCSIITCCKKIVEGLGTLSEHWHSFFLPMIALSTDLTQPHHVYLMDDGLSLWYSILDNASQITDPLLDLAANILPLLDYNNLHLLLQNIQHYILLAPEAFLKRYGSKLLEAMLYNITDIKDEGIKAIIHYILDTTIILFPEEGPVVFESLLGFIFSKISETPYGTYTTYVSLFARVIFHCPKVFWNVLEVKAKEDKKDVQSLLTEYLDLWLRKMTNINCINNRKMMALALSSLFTCIPSHLPTVEEVILYRVCGIFLAVIEVLNDITNVENGTWCNKTDALIIHPNEPVEGDEEDETEGDRRQKELTRLDPVHKVVLRNHFCNQIMALEQNVGSVRFQSLLDTVDSETRQQLQEYLDPMNSICSQLNQKCSV